MKYLYHAPTGQDSLQIKIKEPNKAEYTADNEYSIMQLFEMKATNKYEKIEIRQPGLCYKTSRGSKKNYSLQGWINLNEYEYGGRRTKISFKEQLEALIFKNQNNE